MFTIQEIEKLDLTTLSKLELGKLKRDLTQSFYYTSSKKLTTDGRVLKDVIGNELDRVTDFIMGQFCTFLKLKDLTRNG